MNVVRVFGAKLHTPPIFFWVYISPSSSPPPRLEVGHMQTILFRNKFHSQVYILKGRHLYGWT